ncbi:MAG: SCO family protein [Chitinophagaceae bacterium]|nr:MAG: SCO family protein [Chitinophagaceae bacterium]
MSRKRIYYVVFFTLLFLGFVAALGLFVPDFFNKRIPPVAEVQPFSFTDQDGRTVTQQDLAGKVAAVNFFFTTCRGVCPKMNNNLKPVYEDFKGEKDFILLSHTSDPEVDSVPVLRRYADSMAVDTRQWRFLTGPKEALYNAARRSYAIDDPNNNLQSPEDDFLHSQFIALVNREGKVMKIYDGLKANEMQELRQDVRKLLGK